mgnify:CR=1 FL=1
MTMVFLILVLISGVLSVFKSIFKSKTILDSVFNNIETNLDIEELKPYIPTVAEFEIESNIVSKQLPGTSEKCNDLWFFIQDKVKTKELIRELELK